MLKWTGFLQAILINFPGFYVIDAYLVRYLSYFEFLEIIIRKFIFTYAPIGIFSDSIHHLNGQFELIQP